MAGQRSGPVLGLLAVANRGSATSIHDWVPFGGATLGEIVRQCNERCESGYRRKPLTGDDQGAVGELYDLLPFDAATVPQVTSEQLATLKFIVLDVAAGSGGVLNYLRALIPRLTPLRKVFVAKVGRDRDGVVSDDFPFLPVYPSRPEFPATDEQLTEFLLRFCEILAALEDGFHTPPGPPPGDRRRPPPDDGTRPGGRPVRGEGPARGRMGRAMELLDVALEHDLDADQARRLARTLNGLGDVMRVIPGTRAHITDDDVAWGIKAGVDWDALGLKLERDPPGGPPSLSLLDGGFLEERLERDAVREWLREGATGTPAVLDKIILPEHVDIGFGPYGKDKLIRGMDRVRDADDLLGRVDRDAGGLYRGGSRGADREGGGRGGGLGT